MAIIYPKVKPSIKEIEKHIELAKKEFIQLKFYLKKNNIEMQFHGLIMLFLTLLQLFY